MPAAHRNLDSRACGAKTISLQNKNVYVNGKLWSVNNDPNSHGAGNLIAKTNNVFIGGKMVVNLGDAARPDSLCPRLKGLHCAPFASSGSPNVFVGG
jgi:uncharacterized Zn-binding protein involved in type VI secretion